VFNRLFNRTNKNLEELKRSAALWGWEPIREENGGSFAYGPNSGYPHHTLHSFEWRNTVNNKAVGMPFYVFNLYVAKKPTTFYRFVENDEVVGQATTCCWRVCAEFAENYEWIYTPKGLGHGLYGWRVEPFLLWPTVDHAVAYSRLILNNSDVTGSRDTERRAYAERYRIHVPKSVDSSYPTPSKDVENV
jgi:hypothetical protein